MKGTFVPIVILFLIIGMAIIGSKKSNQNIIAQNENQKSFLDFDFTGQNQTSNTNQPKTKEQLEYEILVNQRKADEIKTELAKQEEAKKWSLYKEKINFLNGGGYNANTEYLIIESNSLNKEDIKITGWTIVSTSTGQSVNIPKSTLLYFTNSINSEEDVYLKPGEKAYIITGKSPVGYGMKTNKCSGYLSQYNSFYPYLYSNCPQARYEDLSSIPKTVNNDNCFDLIESYPSCRVQDTPLSNAYSSECQNFIYTKMTYPNCINTHKNDKDFWGNEWRIYLKRNDRLWKDRRETIILYDDKNKPVGKILKY